MIEIEGLGKVEIQESTLREKGKKLQEELVRKIPRKLLNYSKSLTEHSLYFYLVDGRLELASMAARGRTSERDGAEVQQHLSTTIMKDVMNSKG